MMYFETSRDTQTFYHQGDNRCTAHMHRSVEFLYVLEGEKRVWLNGKRYDLQSGDFILCPPYCVHRYEPAENGLQIVATIPTEHCEKFDELCKNALPQTHVLRDTEGELLRLIKALNKPPNVLFFSGVANLILGIFMAKVPFFPAQNGKERALVEQIAKYIDEAYDKPLTLSTLAARFGYSPNYFSWLFKQHFKTSFPQYLNGIRVRKSLPLLRTKKVYAVCYECGFNSPQQYYLHFKKFYGCSPKEFLKNENKG